MVSIFIKTHHIKGVAIVNKCLSLSDNVGQKSEYLLVIDIFNQLIK